MDTDIIWFLETRNHLSNHELMAIRNVLKELDKASKRDDILGVFAKGQLNTLPIPVTMWAKGHPLL